MAWINRKQWNWTGIVWLLRLDHKKKSPFLFFFLVLSLFLFVPLPLHFLIPLPLPLLPSGPWNSIMMLWGSPSQSILRDNMERSTLNGTEVSGPQLRPYASWNREKSSLLYCLNSWPTESVSTINSCLIPLCCGGNLQCSQNNWKRTYISISMC